MTIEATQTWWRLVAAIMLAVVTLAFTLFVVLLVVTHADQKNERADPSVWIDPKPDDGYVYREDPCVEALRAAMEAMEPFLPGRLHGADPLWESLEFYSRDGKAQLEEARRTWFEAKLQCWRH